MEFKRALIRLKKDVLGLLSASYILLIALVALFAYPISSDKTKFANQMHLSIHSKPPGFNCKMLIIPNSSESSNSSFLWGDLNPNEEIPIEEIRWLDKSLTFKRMGNGTNHFEKILFSEFSTEMKRNQIEENYIKEKVFYLGTDKYGRDLFSRLIIGSRISISIGFVAVFISLILGVFFWKPCWILWRYG